MEKNLKLVEGVNTYRTTISSDCEDLFGSAKTIIDDNDITIMQYGNVFNFYEKNYIACTFTATYTDLNTAMVSTGATVLIVELHHDLWL